MDGLDEVVAADTVVDDGVGRAWVVVGIVDAAGGGSVVVVVVV